MWLVLLASHDQHLDLDRQLIGMPVTRRSSDCVTARRTSCRGRDDAAASRAFAARLSHLARVRAGLAQGGFIDMPLVPNQELTCGTKYIQNSKLNPRIIFNYGINLNRARLKCFRFLSKPFFRLGVFKRRDIRVRLLQQRFHTRWLRYSGPATEKNAKAFILPHLLLVRGYFAE
jgi:hypothetical protein